MMWSSRRRRWPRDAYAVTAIGDDRPGIVAQMAVALADRDVNTPTCRAVWSATGSPCTRMVAELGVPPEADGDALARAIADLASEMGVDATVREVETETL